MASGSVHCIDTWPIISRRARAAVCSAAGMATLAQLAYHRRRWVPLVCTALVFAAGCVQRAQTPSPVSLPTQVVALAPVLNLSGSRDFDPLRITDLLASEFVSCEGVAVVPVNMTLAELERRGKLTVETPQEAAALAQALGADATIVVAITEYNPYYPPVVGMVVQWYSASAGGSPQEDSGDGADGDESRSVTLSDVQGVRPRWQIERVFNAAQAKTLAEVRTYATARDGHESPYGWRKYVQSQELYVRYCGWEMIRTMLRLDRDDPATVRPNETKS